MAEFRNECFLFEMHNASNLIHLQGGQQIFWKMCQNGVFQGNLLLLTEFRYVHVLISHLRFPLPEVFLVTPLSLMRI